VTGEDDDDDLIIDQNNRKMLPKSHYVTLPLQKLEVKNLKLKMTEV